MDRLTLFALTLTVCLWASAFAVIRMCLEGCGVEGYLPGELATLRFLTASLALGILAVSKRMRLPAKADLPVIFVSGVFGIAGYQLALNYGELTVTAGAAGLFVNTCPIFTALLGYAVVGERLNLWGWAGIAIGFSGAALIAYGHSKGFKLEPGIGLLLFAAVSWALYILVQKPMLRKYTSLEYTSYAIWAGTALLTLLYLPGTIAKISHAPAAATRGAIYLGLFPTAIGYVTWGYVLSRLPASIASSFLYIVPALGIVVAWLMLGEVPSVYSVVGGVVVIAGVALLNAKGKIIVVKPATAVQSVPASVLAD